MAALHPQPGSKSLIAECLGDWSSCSFKNSFAFPVLRHKSVKGAARVLGDLFSCSFENTFASEILVFRLS